MRKIGIIQPGAIGDIINLLPAMKYLKETQDAHIIWPIREKYVWLFIEIVDYITFVPVTDNIHLCVNESYNILKNIYKVDEIFDIAATFPGSISTGEYIQRGEGDIEPYDSFKYYKLNVPVEEKWNLSIKRNYEKEDLLYNTLVKDAEYVVSCFTCSGGTYKINIDIGNRQLIEMNNNHNLFHWIKIFENAKAIILLNSGVLCLVNQLNIKTKKVVFKVPNGKLPLLTDDWEIRNG